MTAALATMKGWTRWVLLGADDSWGATLATGKAEITLLALLAFLIVPALILEERAICPVLGDVAIEMNWIVWLAIRKR